MRKVKEVLDENECINQLFDDELLGKILGKKDDEFLGKMLDKNDELLSKILGKKDDEFLKKVLLSKGKEFIQNLLNDLQKEL